MVLVHFFIEGIVDTGKLIGLGHREEILDRLVQGMLVAFESQHVLRTLVDELGGKPALTTHGIEGDDATGQLQQLRDRRDFSAVAS